MTAHLRSVCDKWRTIYMLGSRAVPRKAQNNCKAVMLQVMLGQPSYLVSAAGQVEGSRTVGGCSI
jgi:hypothetical protein